jgi:hypothetical protein
VVTLRVRVDTAPVTAFSLTVAGSAVAAGSSSGHPVRSEPKDVTDMSAYVLSWDHIGFLVNLGQQLDLRGVHVGDIGYQSLALYDEHDRRYVAAELMAQCRTSVAHRYCEQVTPVTDVPEIHSPRTPMRNLAELAQALEWVRCYQYQSCEDPGWRTTFAYHYTERLRTGLETRIIACFATTWNYDGAPLTPVRPRETTRPAGHNANP